MKELKLDDDFGFSMVDPKEEMERLKATRDPDPRIDEIRKLIFPLLDNLMKDPHKDIRWPDRDKKIGELKAKIENIMMKKD